MYRFWKQLPSLSMSRQMVGGLTLNYYLSICDFLVWLRSNWDIDEL